MAVVGVILIIAVVIGIYLAELLPENNGVFIEKFANREALARAIKEKQPSLLEPLGNHGGRTRYSFGTTKATKDMHCSRLRIWMRLTVRTFDVASMSSAF